MENEIWRPIKDYEGFYMVSSFGRVKSLDRVVNHIRFGSMIIQERILKPSSDKKGYMVVGLSKEGVLKGFKVHTLVAIYFLNHIPCGHKIVIDHKDENPSNNHIDNLQLITQRENLSRSKKGGLSSFIGVSFDKASKKFTSRILINGKAKWLGHFKDEIKAAEAYQVELRKIA